VQAKRRHWTAAEDAALRAAVQKLGAKRWKLIANEIEGRDDGQCLQRWRMSLQPNIVKGKWSSEHDALLIRLVESGEKDWGKIATKIPGRTTKQVRQRWSFQLDPSLNHGPFTPEEDSLLLEKCAELGASWSKIAVYLPSRTPNAVKVRFKTLNRKRQRQPVSTKTLPAVAESTSKASKQRRLADADTLLQESCQEIDLLLDILSPVEDNKTTKACTLLATLPSSRSTPDSLADTSHLIIAAQSHLVYAYADHYRSDTKSSVAHALECLQVVQNLNAMAVGNQVQVMEGWGLCVLACTQAQAAESRTWSRNHACMTGAAVCDTTTTTVVSREKQMALLNARTAMTLAHNTKNFRLRAYCHLSLALSLLSEGTHAAAEEATVQALDCIKLYDSDAQGCVGNSAPDYRLLGYGDCVLARCYAWCGYGFLKQAELQNKKKAAHEQSSQEVQTLFHTALTWFEKAFCHARRSQRISNIGKSFGFTTVPKIQAWLGVVLQACLNGAERCGVTDPLQALAHSKVSSGSGSGSVRGSGSVCGTTDAADLVFEGVLCIEDGGELPADPPHACVLCGRLGNGCGCLMTACPANGFVSQAVEAAEGDKTAQPGLGPWGLGSTVCGSRACDAHRQAAKQAQLDSSSPWLACWKRKLALVSNLNSTTATAGPTTTRTTTTGTAMGTGMGLGLGRDSVTDILVDMDMNARLSDMCTDMNSIPDFDMHRVSESGWKPSCNSNSRDRDSMASVLSVLDGDMCDIDAEQRQSWGSMLAMLT